MPPPTRRTLDVRLTWPGRGRVPPSSDRPPRSRKGWVGPAIHDPNYGHFRGQPTFYEGWYARVTQPGAGPSFSLIHGVFNPGRRDGRLDGYVIALEGQRGEQIHEDFPPESLLVDPASLKIELGPCRMTERQVAGRVVEGGDACDWQLEYRDTVPWADRGHQSPMSYALRLPPTWLETSWHVVHMTARVSGRVTWKGETTRFDRAWGYVEKVWGRVFPAEWIWLQANTFEDRPGMSLAVSGGRVPLPFGGLSVPVYAAGFYDGQRLHAFATHHGAWIRAGYSAGRWDVDARTPSRRLVVTARCDPSELAPLAAPTPEGLRPIALESLAGHVRVQRMERTLRGWHIVDEAHADRAGVEIGDAKRGA